MSNLTLQIFSLVICIYVYYWVNTWLWMLPLWFCKTRFKKK